MKKPILAIYSLTCCEGCSVELLNLGERLLEIFKVFELGNFSWAEEKKERPYYDISLVEGTPLNKEEIKRLKEIRKKTKILIAFGSCAHLGGVQKIKNYLPDKDKTARYVYPQPERVENMNVVPLSKIVKVDYILPGCPVNKEEVIRVLSDLLVDKPPQILRRPVCFECQSQGYECLLQKGESCLGPLILGGCQAVCLKSKIICSGCRGLLPEYSPVKHLENLEKLIGKKKLREVTQTFGAADDILRY